MEEIFFSVIIPNYNNGEWLNKSLPSVLNQTFRNFELFFIDDMSTDNSIEIAKKYCENSDIQYKIFELKEKAWNGGCRNIGIKEAKGKYIIFLDSDDWIKSLDNFQKLYDHIIENNYPDLVRLNFTLLTKEGDEWSIDLREESTPKKIIESCYVACWTKCIKKDLMVLFPENTLMEDVVQTIHQLDKIKTTSNFVNSFVMYNRQNVNSCSIDENNNLQNGKWKSSMYRYCADLMDLKVEHDYCEKRRKEYLNAARGNLKEDKYIQ